MNGFTWGNLPKSLMNIIVEIFETNKLFRGTSSKININYYIFYSIPQHYLFLVDIINRILYTNNINSRSTGSVICTVYTATT